VVITSRQTVGTSGQGDAHDVTDTVTRAVEESALRSGTVTVFVVGSTAGVTSLEFEPGVIADLNKVLESLAPRHGGYQHHLRWGDDNGSSHVRAALVGPSVTIPFTEGKLLLGTWQQVVLLEFDTRPRKRELVIQLVGE
jgi:secondary thiamine-phosphate synthase enzyme